MKRLSLYIYVALFFASCHSASKYDSYKYTQYSIVEEAEDSLIQKMVEPYRTQIASKMAEVLCISDIEMPKLRGKSETLLGNFEADLVLEVARKRTSKPIDICLLNTGGLRNSLPKGAITRGDIFELMPFENELVIVTLRPASFQKMLDYLAATGGHPVSGLRMEIKNKMVFTGEVGRHPVGTNDTNSYRVVTSDFLYYGGDKMNFLQEGDDVEFLNYKLRDCIIDYCIEKGKTGEHVGAVLDDRIKILDQP